MIINAKPHNRGMCTGQPVRSQYDHLLNSVKDVVSAMSASHLGFVFAPGCINSLCVFYIFSVINIIQLSRKRAVAHFRLDSFNIFVLPIYCLLMLVPSVRQHVIMSIATGRFSMAVPTFVVEFAKVAQDYCYDGGLVDHKTVSLFDIRTCISFILFLLFQTLVMLGLKPQVNESIEGSKTQNMVNLNCRNVVQYADKLQYSNIKPLTVNGFGDTASFSSLITNHQMRGVIEHHVLNLINQLLVVESSSNFEFAVHDLIDSLNREVDRCIRILELPCSNIDSSSVRRIGMGLYSFSFIESVSSPQCHMFTTVTGASTSSRQHMLLALILRPTLSAVHVQGVKLTPGVSHGSVIRSLTIPISTAVNELFHLLCVAESGGSTPPSTTAPLTRVIAGAPAGGFIDLDTLGEDGSTSKIGAGGDTQKQGPPLLKPGKAAKTARTDKTPGGKRNLSSSAAKFPENTTNNELLISISTLVDQLNAIAEREKRQQQKK